MSVKIPTNILGFRSSDIEVISTSPEIKTSANPSAEIYTTDWVLATASDRGLLGKNIPAWLSEAILNQVENNNASINDTIDILTTLIHNIDTGVHQDIDSIQTKVLSQNTTITTNKSELDKSIAAAYTYTDTKVTPLESRTTDLEAFGSEWNNDTDSLKSYIANIATTKASEYEASSQVIQGLTSTVNNNADGQVAISTNVNQYYTEAGIDPVTGQLTAGSGYLNDLTARVGNTEISLETQEGVITGQFQLWDGTSTPKKGMYKIQDGSYWNYVGGTLGENSDGWIRTDRKALDEVTALDVSTTTKVTKLQEQIDASIDTWFYDYSQDTENSKIPTLGNLPAKDWGDSIEKTKHLNDLVYDTSTGYTYRFIYENSLWVWSKVTDVDLIKALADASHAQSTADHKKTIYGGSTPPVGVPEALLGTGDMWIPSGYTGTDFTDGEIYLYVEGHNPVWVKYTKYSEAIEAVVTELHTWQTGTYDIFVKDIKKQVDHKAESYYQDSPDPSTVWDGSDEDHVGDLWKTPGDGNKEYVWKLEDGSYQWVAMEVPDIVFDTIDTKKTIYTGNDVPSPAAPDKVEANDIWITGSNAVSGYASEEVYVYTLIDVAAGTYAWRKPLKYTDNTLAEKVFASVKKYESNSGLIAEAFADGDLTIFTSIAEPTDAEPYDLWRLNKEYVNIDEWDSSDPEVSYITDSNYIYKYYDGSEWQFATSNQVAMIKTTLNITDARDLADGKVRIFNTTPFVPYDEGDLWILDGEIFKSSVDNTTEFNSSDWGVATKYTDDTVAKTKNVTFTQNTEPTALAIGDLWIDTSDNNHPKRWDGTKWKTIRDGSIALASASASDALSIANTALNASDGTITVYYEKEDPFADNPIAIGDIWVDIDNDPEMAYRWRVDKADGAEKWMAISDTGISAALVAAQTAQTTADGKIVASYVDGPTGPSKTADDVGDLWYDTADNNKPYYWSGSVWIPIQDGTIAIAQAAADVADGKAVIADGKAEVAQQSADNIVAGVDGFQLDLSDHLMGTVNFVEYLQIEKDKQFVVYSGTDHTDYQSYLNDDAALKSGDLFVEGTTETGTVSGKKIAVTKTYRYDGNDWVEIKNNDTITSLADFIDGKRTIFNDDQDPISKAEIGDLWFTTTETTGFDPEDMYILGESGWYKATKFTEKIEAAKQYAIDIENGTKLIDLTKYVDDAGWNILNATNTANGVPLSTWVTDTYDINILATQEKLDSKVESYYTNNNVKPYEDNEGAAKNDGDLWYSTTTKLLHRYKYISDTDRGWVLIEDQKAIAAAAAASTAQSTADGKIVTWINNSPIDPTGDTPQQNGEGDIWVRPAPHNEMFRYNGTYPYSADGWVSVRDTKNDGPLAAAAGDIAGLKETDDGVVNSFYQKTEPTNNMSYGDWWIDNTALSAPVAYRYEDANGKSVGNVKWRINTTHPLGKVYLQAIDAQYTADGKIKSFFQDNVPTSEGVGDIWVDTNNKNATYIARSKGANEIKDGEWEKATDDSGLDNFINTMYAVDKLNIGNQLDGVAVTYFQKDKPYLKTEGKVANNGDVWFNTSNNKAYKFKYEVYDEDGITVISPSDWIEITDTNILSSLLAASKTKAAADRSIKNFTTDLTPEHPFFEGDTWMEGESGDIYVCLTDSVEADNEINDPTNADGNNSRKNKWIIASRYAAEIDKFNTYLIDGNKLDLSKASIDIEGTTTSFSTILSEQNDKAIEVFSGTDHTQQTNRKPGDLYIQKVIDNSNSVPVDLVTTYKCNLSGDWVEISSNDNITSLASMADSKRTIYANASDDVPAGDLNDIWIPVSGTNDLIYIPKEIYLMGSNGWELATTYNYDLLQSKNDLIDASRHDGAFSAARAESSFTIYNEVPDNPEPYDILAVLLDDVTIDEYDATSSETVLLSEVVYWSGIAPTETKSIAFKYWNPDKNDWVFCSPLMISAIKAISQSLTTSAFIDSKARIFNVTPFPPYEVGDLWVQGTEGDMLRCITDKLENEEYSNNDWENSSKYTDDTEVNAVKEGLSSGSLKINLSSATVDGHKPFVIYVGEEIDKQVVIFSGTDHTTQTGMKKNDIYIEKTVDNTGSKPIDVVNTYKYNGNTWDSVSSNDNLIALADLTDGKRTVYSDSKLPIEDAKNPFRNNDLFIPTKDFKDPIENKNYIADEMYRYVESGSEWKKATRYDAIHADLKGQIDGKVEMFYGGATPPYANSITDDKKVGDYWFCSIDGDYNNGVVYKYNKSYVWEKSTDVSKGAFDLAKGKRTVYGNDGFNVPDIAEYPDLQLNDLWMPIADGGAYKASQIYRCNNVNAPEWVGADYTNDDALNDLKEGRTSLDASVVSIGGTKLNQYVKKEADKRVHIYSGTVPPEDATLEGVESNDVYLFYTTTKDSKEVEYDIIKTYKYDGANWNPIPTTNDISRLSDLSDGKRTIYSGSTLPSADPKNPFMNDDLFLATATFTADKKYTEHEMYRYYNGDWIKSTRYDDLQDALSKQIDKKIQTYYQSTVPFANQTGVIANPAKGDFWYCTHTSGGYENGKVYEYIESVNGELFDYTWTEAANVSKYLFDLTNKKRSIYGGSGNTIPTTTSEEDLALNDLWIPETNGDTYKADNIYKCTNLNPIKWTKADYTNDDTIDDITKGNTPLDPDKIKIGTEATHQKFTDFLTAEIDSKINIYSGHTAPVDGEPEGVSENDIYVYFTTGTSEKGVEYGVTETYKYSSANHWDKITSNSNITALADLTDNKRTVFDNDPSDGTEEHILVLANVPDGDKNDLWLPPFDAFKDGVLVYKANELYIKKDKWELATTFGDDIVGAKEDLIDAAKHDGAFEEALADGEFIIYTAEPTKPQPYDVVTVSLNVLELDEYSAVSPDTYLLSSQIPWTGEAPLEDSAVAFKYWNPEEEDWVMCSPTMFKGIKALIQLLDVNSLADKKARVFTATPFTPYDKDDVWMQGKDGDILTCVKSRTKDENYNEDDWETSNRYIGAEEQQAFADEVNPKIDLLKQQSDHKIQYFIYDVEGADPVTNSSTIEPSSNWTTKTLKDAHNGDILYYKDTHRAFRYNSASHTWVLDETLVDIVSKIEKNMTKFYQSDEPTAEQGRKEGDQWIDSDTQETYVYDNDKGWIPVAERTGTFYNATYAEVMAAVPFHPTKTPMLNDLCLISDKWYTENENDKDEISDSDEIAVYKKDGNNNVFVGKTKAKKALAKYNGDNWVIEDYDSKAAIQVSWVGGATKLLYDPDGGITGWEFGNTNDAPSEFKIHADNFKFTNSASTVTPFEINVEDSANPIISFKGRINISGVTRTHTNNDNKKVELPINSGSYLGEFSTINKPNTDLLPGDEYYDEDTQIVMKWAGSAWVSTKGFTPALLNITNTGAVFNMDDVNTITPADGITLNTTHSGINDTVTYQWYKDGSSISGETSSSLLVPKSDYTNNTTHTYKCIATGTIYGVTSQTREDEITIPRIDSATNTPIVVLSNENITFSAPVSGFTGIPFSHGVCYVSAYIGSTELTYGSSGNNTFSLSLSTSHASVTHTGPEVNAPTAMDEDEGYADVVVTFRDSTGTELASPITKRITYNLSRTGLAAPIFYITNSDSKFIKGKDGVISPPSIPLKTSMNFDSETSYNWYSSTDGGAHWSNSLGTTKELIVSSTNYTTKMYKCEFVGELNGETTTLVDKVTIPLLTDASEAITVINSNTAIPLATTALSGEFTLPSSGVNSEITVYQGSTKLNYVSGTPSANQWTASISSTGFSSAPSGAGSTSTDTYTVTASSKVMSSDNAQTTVTITVKDAAGTSTTKTSVINYALARKGNPGNPGFNPTVTDNHDGTYTITGSTGDITFNDGYTPVKGTDYFDGDDGTSVKLQYSSNTTDGTDGSWHDTLAPDTDKWVRSGIKVNGETVYTYQIGVKFIPTKGVEYDDGNSSYLHIKYSNDGTTFTSNYGEDLGTWIGSYVDDTELDSSTFGTYHWKKFVGDDAVAPTVTEGTDSEGRTTYTVTTYNNDGSVKDSETLLQPLKNVDYYDGTSGQFVSYVFKVQNSGTPSIPEGGDFTGTVEHMPSSDSVDWTDTPTHTDTQVEWVSKRIYTATKNSDGTETWNGGDWSTPKVFYKKGDQGIQGVQGVQGNQGIPGTNGIDGVSTYFHVAYANNSTGSSGFNQSSGTYIGTYVDSVSTDSTNYSDYNWVLLKGADGADGTNGIAGTNGIDGKTTYLHIKYSNNNGSSFTSNSGETVGYYIGTYTDFTLADSTDVNDYNWAQIKGEQGLQGPAGADGNTTYTWVKYAEDANGNGLVNTWSSGKSYIGFAYNKTTATESTDANDYVWSKIEGTDGQDGSDGVNGINGSDGIDGKSIWYRWTGTALQTIVSATIPEGDGWTQTESAAVNLKGDTGNDGIDGADGINGTDGISIIFKGSFSSNPANPSNGWSYYNTTDKKSYVYQNEWYQMTVDGTDGQDGRNGTNGLSIVWKGEVSDPSTLGTPQENWVYKDTDNNKVYIYNGSAWELMVLDGSDGSDGADGSDGFSVYITYNNSTSTTAPALPTNVDGTNNGWTTTATSSAIWMSQKVDDGTTTGWGDAIKIKGEDATTYYTWVKYSPTNDTSKNDIYDTWEAGRKYIGISYGNGVPENATDISNDKTRYTWTRIEGANGNDGKSIWYKWVGTSLQTVVSDTTPSGGGWTQSESDAIDLKGDGGNSAYELAVLNGYNGTEAEWLSSLPGNRGPGWFAGTTQEDPRYDWNADTDIGDTLYEDAEHACDGSPVNGDIVTLVGEDSSGHRQVQANKYSNGSWISPGVYVDGDMIVDGTISGKKVRTGEITSINWDGSHGMKISLDDGSIYIA